MAGTKLSTAKRKAAAKVFINVFHVMNAAHHTLAFFESAADLADWDGTFTEREKQYIKKLRARLHEDGELVRRFGQRLR